MATARPFIFFRWLAGFAVLAFLVIGAGILWVQQTQIEAPLEPGICWRMNAPGSSPQFVAIARDTSGLEACAADLERIHNHTGATLTGAFQGRFIFVDNEAIRSAGSLSGVHWRLYFDNQRKALDNKLDLRPLEMTTQRQTK